MASSKYVVHKDLQIAEAESPPMFFSVPAFSSWSWAEEEYHEVRSGVRITTIEDDPYQSVDGRDLRWMGEKENNSMPCIGHFGLVIDEISIVDPSR